MKKPDISNFEAISISARERVYASVLQHFKRNPNSPWSGRGLVELEKTLKAFYASIGEEYKVAFRDTLPDIMKSFYDDAVKEIKTAGVYKGIIGAPDPKRIKYFLDNSFQQVAMKTDKMSFDHIRDLRKLSADVLREMSITGGTRKEISKRMLNRAMEIKGFEFIDNGGTKWPTKSYFDMLARTELMNAGRASYDDKMTDEGFDVMKLTTSGLSCAKCAKYEGKLFSLTGTTAGLPSKADLEADGVFHPNCTHSYSLVPDFIRERDYNPDGTRKTAEQEKAAAPFGFVGKKESYASKFDGNFTEQGKALDKQMRKAGVQSETRDEINWNHTPKMQQICGEIPNITSESNWPGVTPGTRNIELGSDLNTWEGCRQTVTHEYGHYVANSIFDLAKTRNFADFEEAVIADWTAVSKTERIARFKGVADGGSDLLKDILAKETFAVKNFSKLSVEQKWRIVADADILGSISCGRYGFGHRTQVYLEDWYREAFANMYLARKYNWTEFAERYPKLWHFMEELMK